VDAIIDQGKLVSVKRKPTSGVPVRRYCPKNAAAPHIIYASDRITTPLIKAVKGSSQDFEKTSWDSALSTIADKLLGYKKDFGPESVAWLKGTGEDWGPVWHYAQRLMHAFGSPNVIGNGSLCHVTRAFPQILTYGSTSRPDTLNTECVIVWGKNDKTSNPPAYDQLIEGVKRGAKLIVIDPIKTDLAASADLWLQIKPGCDGILAMAMMHVIIEEDLFDSDFTSEWTIGFEQLSEEVQKYAPENVAATIHLTPQKICQAARLYSRAKSACIADGNGLDMNADVTANTRAICILRGLCGNLDVKGGDIFPQQAATRDIRLKEELDPSIKPITSDYPLFNSFLKGAGDQVSTVLPDAILTEKPYPIKALIVQASNPLVTAANSNRFKEALEQVEFLVVIDMFMTQTAKLADVFLPVTTTFEKTQLNMAGLTANRLFLQDKVIEPVGESKPDWQIIFDLAKALHLSKHFPFPSIEDAIDFQLEPSGITTDILRKNTDGIKNQGPKEKKYFDNGFNTPSGKVEFYSEDLDKYGYKPIPSFNLAQTGKIAFIDSVEQYPLIAISGEKSGWFVHARYRNIPWMIAKEPEPFVDLDPDDAAKRGIIENEVVKIISPNGEMSVKARLSDVVQPGSIRVPWGWGDYIPESDINHLTDDEERDPVTSTPSVRAFMCEVLKL